MSGPSQRRPLVLLFLLYFAQGLPFGFQKELGSFLKESGIGLSKLTLTRALSAPWMAKVLWAPLVDRFGSDFFGRRKSWIIPMQTLLALACIVTAFFPPGGGGLLVLIGLVILMNFLAATQDIAVDGLAVDLLKDKEFGAANIAQVVGFKAGMLFTGGLLIPLRPRLGWSGILYAIAALLLFFAVVLAFWREPPATVEIAKKRSSMTSVLREMFLSLRAPGALWMVIFVASYKIGEEMVDATLRYFLMDVGYKLEQAAAWMNRYAMPASLIGSLLGGYLVSRLPLLAAVGLCAGLRALSLGGEWYLTLIGTPSPTAVILIAVAEHFCGGALTTAMFAFMMSRVNKAVGGTHYTLLACVEVLGKMPPSLVSGFLAERYGYSFLFGLSTLLSFMFLLLLVPLRRSEASLAKAAEQPS